MRLALALVLAGLLGAPATADAQAFKPRGAAKAEPKKTAPRRAKARPAARKKAPAKKAARPRPVEEDEAPPARGTRPEDEDDYVLIEDL